MSLPRAETVLHVATVFFAANMALGIAVRLRVVSTKEFRWVHHALFFVVVAGAVAAAALGLRDHEAFVWGLAPALGIFALLPRLAGGSARHTAAAVVAALSYAAAYVLTW